MVAVGCGEFWRFAVIVAAGGRIVAASVRRQKNARVGGENHAGRIASTNKIGGGAGRSVQDFERGAVGYYRTIYSGRGDTTRRARREITKLARQFARAS